MLGEGDPNEPPRGGRLGVISSAIAQIVWLLLRGMTVHWIISSAFTEAEEQEMVEVRSGWPAMVMETGSEERKAAILKMPEVVPSKTNKKERK